MQNVIAKVLWYLSIEGYGEFEESLYDFEKGAQEDAFCFRLDFPCSSKFQPDFVNLKISLVNMEFSLYAYRDDSHEEYGRFPGDWDGDWYMVEDCTLLYKVTNTGLTEVRMARMLYVYLKYIEIELPKKLLDPLRDLALGYYRW